MSQLAADSIEGNIQVAVAALHATENLARSIRPEIVLDKPQISIGRGLNCTVCIAKPFLSRKHAVLQYEDDHWHIQNIGSNGILVNSSEIAKDKMIQLSENDSVEFVRGSGLKYVFRTSSGHSSPFASTQICKRPRLDKDNVQDPQQLSQNSDVKVSAHSSSQPDLREALRRREEEFQKEKQQLLDKVNLLEREKEELNSRREQFESEAARLRQRIQTLEETRQAERIDIVQQIENVLEQEFACSICCEFFVSAVTLSCSHTFCKYCIEHWTATANANNCPICRANFQFQADTPAIENVINGIVSCLPPDIAEHRKKLVEQRAAAAAHQARAATASARDEVSSALRAVIEEYRTRRARNAANSAPTTIRRRRATTAAFEGHAATTRGSTTRSSARSRVLQSVFIDLAGPSNPRPLEPVEEPQPGPSRWRRLLPRREAGPPVVVTLDESHRPAASSFSIGPEMINAVLASRPFGDEDEEVVVVSDNSEQDQQRPTLSSSSSSSGSESSNSQNSSILEEEDSNSGSNSTDSYDEGIPGMRYGGYGRCFNCGRQGHWAPGCPY